MKQPTETDILKVVRLLSRVSFLDDCESESLFNVHTQANTEKKVLVLSIITNLFRSENPFYELQNSLIARSFIPKEVLQLVDDYRETEDEIA